MIWLGRAPAGSTVSGARHLPRLAPIMSLAEPAAGPARVFANATMSIYRLPDPAPYFSASDGPCRLLAQGRKAVRATCDAPAALVRRELFFPGWQARVNGAEVPLRRADSIFQSVALPKGSSDVRFFYRPPFTRLSVALALLAALAWVAAVVRGWAANRARNHRDLCQRDGPPGMSRPTLALPTTTEAREGSMTSSELAIGFGVGRAAPFRERRKRVVGRVTGIEARQDRATVLDDISNLVAGAKAERRPHRLRDRCLRLARQPAGYQRTGFRYRPRPAIAAAG